MEAAYMGPLFSAPVDSGTTTIAGTATRAAQKVNIFERAICVQLSTSRLGTRRKVSNEAVTTDADPELVHVAAEILESKELDAIKRCDRAMAEYLRSRASGPALFKGGVYLLSIDLVDSTDAMLSAMLSDRSQLVAEFLAVYETQRDATKAKLKTVATRITWPAVEKVRASFGVSLRYLSFDTPAALEGVSSAIWQREKENAAREWAEALDECKMVLRGGFSELVDHLVDRLQPDPETGKRRKFQDSMIEKFDEFVKTFNARNITDDAALADLVARAREIMRGVGASELRSNEALRNAVAQSMRDIKSAVDPLIVDAPTRRYNADEE